MIPPEAKNLHVSETPAKFNERHPLDHIYGLALSQLEKGKGKERHGEDRSFLQQKWVHITDAVGLGFLTGQAIKKLEEAVDCKDKMSYAEWEKEMVGALNYIAMAVYYEKMRLNLLP